MALENRDATGAEESMMDAAEQLYDACGKGVTCGKGVRLIFTHGFIHPDTFSDSTFSDSVSYPDLWP
jgi:hypothetical protein